MVNMLKNSMMPNTVKIKAPVGTIQYHTIVKKNCTIVLYLRICDKSCGTNCTIGDYHTGFNFENFLDKMNNFFLN